MPSRHDYVALAKSVKRELDESHLAFRSYERRALTDRLRDLSGEPNTRIKAAGMAKEIEEVFAEQGLRLYPKLSETTTGHWIRVWRAGTIPTEVLDLVLNPGERSDAELGQIATKMKGRWAYQ